MDIGEEGGASTSQKSKFTVRTSLRAVHELLEQLDLDQRAAVDEIGLGSLLEIRCTRIHRDLCHWLCDRFDHHNCRLSVHGREIPISIRDVEIVLGVSGSGSDVEAHIERSKQLSGIAKELGYGKGDLQLRNLKARMLSGNSSCNNEDFKRCFTLYMLGTLLCPTTGLEVKSSLLWLVRDASMIAELNWSKFILQDLLKAFRSREKGNSKGLRGCILFLQLFYLDRVTPKTMVFEPFLARPQSRIKFWGDIEVKNHLDALLPNSTLKDLDKDAFTIDDCPTPFENANSVHSKVKQVDFHDPCMRRLNSMDSKIAKMNDALANAMSMLSAIQSDLRDLKTVSGVASSGDIRKETPGRNRSALKTPAGKESQPNLQNSNSNSVLNQDTKEKSESLDTLLGANHYKVAPLGPEPDPTGQWKKFQTEAKQLLRSSRCLVEGFEELEDVLDNEQSPQIIAETKIQSCFVDITGSMRSDKVAKVDKGKGVHAKGRKGYCDVEHEAKDSSVGAVASNEAKAVNNALPPTPLQQDDSMSVLRVGKKVNTRQTGEKRPSKYVTTPYVKVPAVKKNKKGNRGCKEKGLQHTQVKSSGICNPNSLIESELEDYIFNASYPQKEIIVKIGFEHASRGSLRCLCSGSWIKDSVINMVVNMLRLELADENLANVRPTWYMPTYFSLKLQQENLDYDFLSAYLAADRYGGEIKSCCKVFIPMNVGNMHWYCLLIDFDVERVFVLDSLPSKRRHGCVPQVVQAFDKICSRVFGDGYVRAAASFAVETPKLPKQNNSHDCGVHVVNYMEAGIVEKMKDIQFESKSERMRIAKRLVMHDKNVWRFLVEGHLQSRQRS